MKGGVYRARIELYTLETGRKRPSVDHFGVVWFEPPFPGRNGPILARDCEKVTHLSQILDILRVGMALEPISDPKRLKNGSF